LSKNGRIQCLPFWAPGAAEADGVSLIILDDLALDPVQVLVCMLGKTVGSLIKVSEEEAGLGSLLKFSDGLPLGSKLGALPLGSKLGAGSVKEPGLVLGRRNGSLLGASEAAVTEVDGGLSGCRLGEELGRPIGGKLRLMLGRIPSAIEGVPLKASEEAAPDGASLNPTDGFALRVAVGAELSDCLGWWLGMLTGSELEVGNETAADGDLLCADGYSLGTGLSGRLGLLLGEWEEGLTKGVADEGVELCCSDGLVKVGPLVGVTLGKVDLPL